MRRLCACLLLFAASAFAQDDGIRGEVEAALARGDRSAALAALDAVAAEGKPDRQRSVEAAHAAMDLVKGPEGNLRAARLLVDTLRRDRSDANGAYALAMGLKKRLFLEFDAPALRTLLEWLCEIYPEYLEFRYSLALALRDLGLLDEARKQYEQIGRIAPSDRDSRLELAFLEEERGATDAAIALYDDLVRQRPNDLKAHLLKTQLLWRSKSDFGRAREAVAAGLAAGNATEPSANRDWYLQRFEKEGSDLAAEERHRADLHRIRDSLDGTLRGVCLAWALVLGGGLVLLRRMRWI